MVNHWEKSRMPEAKPSLDPSFRASLSRYLSFDIIDGLPERSALTIASRHLNTVRVALSSFLPRYIADAEDLLTKEYSDFRPGTFMFADVSGFTALSEKLQQATGAEGAEIMTQIINDFFSTMLEILAKSDGQMLKFAGDALLTFFPITAEESDDPGKMVAGKAIRTGLRMQRAMKQKFQPIQHPLLKELFGDHSLQLTMSIGVAKGLQFEALVGNATQRDHMIMGTLPASASAAEEAGVRDDVIIDAELAALFKDEFTLSPAPQGENFFQVLDNLGKELGDFELTTIISRRRSTMPSLVGFGDQIDPLEELRRLLNHVDNHARFVAAEVVNKLAIAGDKVEAQNRPATVMFAFFRGIAQLLETWGAGELPRITHILNRFYNSVQQVIAAYGGSLTRSDPYRDGSKLLVTFGAPIAHPDDPFRAVATALGLLQALKQFNEQVHKELPPDLQRESYLEMRMGIAHGQVFAGEVGWKQRREYTVMGDDVNLAARLMGLSEMGNIWISERVYNRVERYFEIERLEPMKMKGKSKLVQAFNVTGWQADITDIPRTSNTRFIGRDTLLLTMEYALEQVRARRRRIIALAGPTGIGKTRVAKQILQKAKDKGFDTSWATCLTMDNPTVTWATIIGQLINLSQDASWLDKYKTLKAALEKYSVPELEKPFSSLLFGSMGTASKDHETGNDTRQLSFENENVPDEELDAAIVQFLTAVIADHPILIVLDDLHKANPIAVRITQRVMNTIKSGRLFMVLGYEVEHSFYDKPTGIDDLEKDETFLIATDILHAVELGSKLARTLWLQTSGRPLFVEAMLQQWQEDNLIEIHRGIAELKDDKRLENIPDQVRNLIMSHFDRLPHEQQAILQAAAVLASAEKEMTWQAVLQVAELEKANAEEILLPLFDAQVLLALNDGQLEIHYGLVQQVVYESLTRLQRQTLHTRAAEYLQAQADAQENFFVIAAHLIKSGKLMRALEMIETAAGEAEKQGDFESAIEYYEHALALFPNDRSLQQSLARVVQRAAQLIYQQAQLKETVETVAVSAPEASPETPSTEPEPPKKKKVDPLSITNVVRAVMNDKSKGVGTTREYTPNKKRKWRRSNPDKD